MTDLAQNFIAYCRQVYQGFKQIKNFRLSHLRKVFSLLGKREKIAVVFLGALAIVTLYLSLRNFYYNHTVPAPGNGGSYTEGLIGQPTYINPLLARQDPDLSLTKLVFSGLYKYDAAGHLVPDLADGQPVISADQKQYTVNLKQNVKWHNEKPLTADDVVFTINTIKDPAFKSPLRSLWLSTDAEKLSDYSVRFTTKDVSGPFAQNLTLPILPKAVWGQVDAQSFLLSDINLKAVGSGPYAVKEIKKSSGQVEQITLEAFADYYLGRPKISTVIVKFYGNENDAVNALHRREIEGYGFATLTSTINLDDGQKNLQILALPLPQYQVVFFNLNNKILADINVRQALTLATARSKIIKDDFNGQALLPTSPLLISQGLNSSPQTSQPDLAAAQKLLDDDGWKVDPATSVRTKNKQPLSLNFVTNDVLLNSKAAQELADQWKALNVTVNFSVMPTKDLMDSVIRPRNFDVLLFPEKFNADPDPFAFWHSSQIKDPGFNLTGFNDPNVDKLITQARATVDQNARQQIYQQLDQTINSRDAVILLDQGTYVYAVDSKVKNIGLKTLYDPSQRFYDIGNWYIDTTRVWK